MKFHPSDFLLREAFGSRDIPQEERRVLLDHLRLCSRCRERLREISPPRTNLLNRKLAERLRIFHQPIGTARVYEAALDRSARVVALHQAAFAREKAEAPARLELLLRQPPERRELLLRNHPRFQTWSLAEATLKKSAVEALKNVRPSEELARLALSITKQLDVNFYGRERIEDLKARSWSQIGNALRIRWKLRSAEAAFSRGFSHLQQGTGDPVEEATCLNLRSSLLRAQQRFGKAKDLLERAVSIFLATGETHLAGRTLLNLETIVSMASSPQEGISILYRAVALIDQEREPHLMFFACHNLLDDLSLAGRTAEAQDLLRRIRPLYDRFATRSAQSRRLWVEGRIALQLGRRSEAQTLLTSARDGFLRDERYQEAAMVSENLRSLRNH